MRIVAEQSKEQLAELRAMREVSWPLRELAANVMRVARGAGRPQDIGRQAQAVVNAFEQYRVATTLWPSSGSLSDALDLARLNYMGEEMPFDPLESAFDTMMRGSLQIAASRLIGQSTQERAGEAEVSKGIDQLEAYRAADRAKYAAKPMTRGRS